MTKYKPIMVPCYNCGKMINRALFCDEKCEQEDTIKMGPKMKALKKRFEKELNETTT